MCSLDVYMHNKPQCNNNVGFQSVNGRQSRYHFCNRVRVCVNGGQSHSACRSYCRLAVRIQRPVRFAGFPLTVKLIKQPGQLILMPTMTELWSHLSWPHLTSVRALKTPQQTGYKCEKHLAWNNAAMWSNTLWSLLLNAHRLWCRIQWEWFMYLRYTRPLKKHVGFTGPTWPQVLNTNEPTIAMNSVRMSVKAPSRHKS